MDDILQSIGDAIHDFFVDVCGGMFIGIFDDANAATGDIASQVGLTPSQWNGSIFTMIQNLSKNVVIPIAGLIITFVLCYGEQDGHLQNAIANRHNDRVQTMEQFRKNRLYCPEEVIWNIGNHNNQTAPEIMKLCFEEYLRWHEQTFPNVMFLNAALHVDEPNASPHIHSRQVWFVVVDGHLMVNQGKALKAMGIERPDPSKKESKRNNAKVTYTAMCHDKWEQIAEAHGIEIEHERKDPKECGLSLLQLKRKTLIQKIEDDERRLAALDNCLSERCADFENKKNQLNQIQKEIDLKNVELEKLQNIITEKQELANNMAVVNAVNIPPRPSDLPPFPDNAGIFERQKQQKKDAKRKQEQADWDAQYETVRAATEALDALTRLQHENKRQAAYNARKAAENAQDAAQNAKARADIDVTITAQVNFQSRRWKEKERRRKHYANRRKEYMNEVHSQSSSEADKQKQSQQERQKRKFLERDD